MSLSPRAAAVKAVLEATPGAVGAPLASTPGVVLYKVMGKMFAIMTTNRIQSVILKCDPHLAEILREQYAGVGHRSPGAGGGPGAAPHGGGAGAGGRGTGVQRGPVAAGTGGRGRLPRGWRARWGGEA